MGTVVLVCVALGAGLAVLASTLTGYSWYNSRRWETKALRATFDHLDQGAGNRVEFYYQVQNNTSSDYYLDINSQPTLMAILKQRHPFSSRYEVLVLQHPIAIPAGQRGVVRIAFGAHEGFGNVGGFVLYDLGRRFRIDFPKGW